METKKRDVIQARGVALQSLTWRDVVVKLLSNEAHLPMRRRVRYVGERIQWFFKQQKGPILEFMRSLRGSPDEHMYSSLYSKTVTIIQNNDMVRNLVFDTFDKAVDRQLLRRRYLLPCALVLRSAIRKKSPRTVWVRGFDVSWEGPRGRRLVGEGSRGRGGADVHTIRVARLRGVV